jgi:SAM-dependent methyltransferase
MQFDFGKNWVAFAHRALTPERIRQARLDFGRLFDGIDIKGKSFLDIGFGQGLSLLLAKEAGANVVGNDINPTCAEALSVTASAMGAESAVPLVLGSILEPTTVAACLSRTNGQGFAIVHSWGVLHHTGDMKTAIAHASSLVDHNGHLVLALYNRHWTSGVWRLIKKAYCSSPAPIQAAVRSFFYPVILCAKCIVTGRNPFEKSRGMDFYYDVVDWIGGYPYEYASKKEIESHMAALGFTCVKCIPAEVPTGCNEFIFQKGKKN